MESNAEDKLKSLGLILPKAPQAVANYVPFIRDGQTLYISGQLSLSPNQKVLRGKLGDTLSLEDGRRAAELCVLNILAQIKRALNDLDQVAQVVKLGGYVNATQDFIDHPAVINGASDLMVAIFGSETGQHVRTAVGCSNLPLGAAVEVEAIVRVKKVGAAPDN
ncbi:MAG: RidA family protein [Pseudomonadota bacterium]